MRRHCAPRPDEAFPEPSACTGFETSLVLPRLWRHDAIPALFASGAVRTYEDLDSSHGLPPDILPFLVAGAFGEDGPDRDAYPRVKSLLADRGASS
ncbi:hypothetical protein ACWKT3_09600 [Streptomyces violaceus]